jgi:DNA mismatch repair protein MutL
MSIIHVLDQETINQIAAGEVIDRPSSVVKELVENAIDAKAGTVTVEIKEGGQKLIRITDNGSGIEADDLQVAFKRHATSKIVKAEDLVEVASLGFRGEALSSIAAIAKVEVITKTKDSFMGNRYVIEGGVECECEEVGAPDGTTFIVRDLFFNTPARRKFLKSSSTEATHICDIVERLALSHPEVSIRLIVNGQNRFHTSGNNKLKDVIYSIYGREIAKQLLEVHLQSEKITITGYLGKPQIAKTNRSHEIYFINGRYIKSKLIQEALEEGCRTFLMQHRFPFAVLHMQIDSEYLDVNVHPAKMELRFREGEYFTKKITECVQSTLGGNDLVPEVVIEETPVPTAIREETEYRPTLKNLPPIPPKPVVKSESKPVPKSEVKPIQQTLFKKEKEELKVEIPPESKIRIVGQLFDTYWVVEYEDACMIIDQHAAHEKVMYEEIVESLQKKTFHTQQLLPPKIITLSVKQQASFEQMKSFLEELGFEMESFGGSEIAVYGMPSNLIGIEPEEFLVGLLDRGMEGKKWVPEEVYEKAATMACKAAIKGNHKMSEREAKTLFDKLLHLKNPYTCPHGRPTMIRMTEYELEKKFKRVL